MRRIPHFALALAIGALASASVQATHAAKLSFAIATQLRLCFSEIVARGRKSAVPPAGRP